MKKKSEMLESASARLINLKMPNQVNGAIYRADLNMGETDPGLFVLAKIPLISVFQEQTLLQSFSLGL